MKKSILLTLTTLLTLLFTTSCNQDNGQPGENLAVPSFTTQPTNQTVTEGADATFTVIATGNPAPTLQWQENQGNGWADLPGETNTTFTKTGTTLTMNGWKYRVIASNSEGSTISDEAV